jgi:dipeptidyl aminopeptidase/acylaminoacyl peptidase
MVEEGKNFDAFSSFFVNRGYAVLQPNFRGSAGRGFAFRMEAIGKMGLKMQDDLEDGLSYLIEQNITDSKRACIVGASYGGYAALMAAVKTPDRFQCAISLAGISDLVELRKLGYGNNALKEQIGNDSDQLKKTSPINGVDNIKIPILLIHGSSDTVVNVNQSRDMVNALKKKNKVYEYVELENGSHNLDSLPSRKQTFEAIEAFLEKYLPTNK